ncbi:hypothetical protein RUM43_013059 [Polyplax serrata]|uniref:Uncharacterized protein n=1 Tax=Polyplax serrata TaxID=468196 RepID=A0AAN8NWG7_POLSC
MRLCETTIYKSHVGMCVPELGDDAGKGFTSARFLRPERWTPSIEMVAGFKIENREGARTPTKYVHRGESAICHAIDTNVEATRGRSQPVLCFLLRKFYNTCMGEMKKKTRELGKKEKFD